ncbi:flavin reductase family protein [Leucobacter soli]|uniref:flavin reductase family protein n=1 Tax=Leucobacter soli TaxID=2812850 RepID=UPI0036218D6B
MTRSVPCTARTRRGDDRHRRGRSRAAAGLAVNAFSSISLDPPLIMVAVNANASTYPWLFSAEHIGVNIVAENQVGVVRAFARSGGDKFAGLDWHPGTTGAPVIDGSAGHFELAVRYKIPAYTHTIFIGEVIEAAATDQPAMIYLGGGFFAQGQGLTPA